MSLFIFLIKQPRQTSHQGPLQDHLKYSLVAADSGTKLRRKAAHNKMTEKPR